MAGLELFLSLSTAVFTLFAAVWLWWVEGRVRDADIKRFTDWVIGASLAFLFAAFARVMELLAPAGFSAVATWLALGAFFIGAFYLLRAAFALRAVCARGL